MSIAVIKKDDVNNKLNLIHQIVNDESIIKSPDYYQVGIDLGTADIQTVVVDQSGTPIAAFLDWADVVKDGIVVDYFGACQIVRNHIEKVENKLSTKIESVITSYPPGTDPKVSTNVIESSGVEILDVIDEPSSVALFLGIDEGAVVDIGGGTTGTAVIRNNKLITSLDEATGGLHVSLTLSGALKITLEEAEILKRNNQDPQMISSIVTPVLENMASIVEKHIDGFDISKIYLTGGGSLVAGFLKVFEKYFSNHEVISFSKALYLTPLAIANHKLKDRNKGNI